MPNIGAPELAIIFAIVVLLFGASRLPKLGKSMGESIKGFKSGLGGSGAEQVAAGPTPAAQIAAMSNAVEEPPVQHTQEDAPLEAQESRHEVAHSALS